MHIVAWTIINLCRGTPQPSHATVHTAIPALNYWVCNCIAHDDLMTDALWALAEISDGQNADARIDVLISANPEITRKIVQLVISDRELVTTGALRVLANFVSGTEEQTKAVIDADLLDVAFLIIIDGQHTTLRKGMCRLLSNIAAGTQEQVQTLTTTKNLVAKLIEMSVLGKWETRKEAIWAVSNIFVNGNDFCVSLLVSQKGIQAMVAVLHESRESEMILVALAAIENILAVAERNGCRHSIELILNECGGPSKVEELQSHVDEAVHEKVSKLLIIISKRSGRKST